MARMLIFLTLIACAAEARGDAPRVLIETGNDQHLAVIGDAFMQAEDEDQKRYFLRSCVFTVDDVQRLCAQFDDKLVPFDPSISVPDETKRTFVALDGRVLILQRGNSNLPMNFGSVMAHITRNRASMQSVAPGVVTFDEMVMLSRVEFGEHSRTFLLQGWLENGVLPNAAKGDGDSRRAIVETNNGQHLTIVGGGFLEANDEDGNRYFLRSCVLAEDDDRRLCARVGDKLLVLYPLVRVPDYSTLKLLIAPDGSVSALKRGRQNELEPIGRLEAAMIPHQVGMKSVAPGVVTFERVVPNVVHFGEEQEVLLLQGWLDRDAIEKE